MVSVDAEQSSEAGDPLVGKIIHDRFRIIAPIARGGMGAVYKAEQAPLGRLVAIKVLSPKHEEEKDPEFRKRFFLEAATVAKLSHPNTITVFDYGQSDGLYFIVMELLDGLTLKAALRRDGAFPPERAVHVVKQICRSLREAHRMNIIHRDMKPGNVMLLEQGDEKDYVKVLDFGLVKEIDADDEEDLTQAGVFMGSPKYMSPEQIQGERVDARSDIYSVGVIFYEMLTGAPPFVRDKQVQILMDHINAPVPPLSTPAGRPPIPEDVASIVRRCLAKRREERFGGMDELLEALKAVGAAGSLGLSTSGEGGVSGGTPVSGVHTVSGDALRASSSGSVTPPALGATGPTPTPSTVSAALPAAAEAAPSGRSGAALTIALSVVCVALAAGIAVALLDPFGGDAPSATESPSPAAGPAPIAAPTTDPPAPADPAPSEPAAIRSVIVELDSTPPGATVRIGEVEYGPTPAQVELTGAQAEPGTELTFAFRADGHHDTTVTRTVPADGSLEVSARLRRIRRATSQGSGEPAGTTQSVTPAGYRESPY